jgi:hypothetical protein
MRKGRGASKVCGIPSCHIVFSQKYIFIRIMSSIGSGSGQRQRSSTECSLFIVAVAVSWSF